METRHRNLSALVFVLTFMSSQTAFPNETPQAVLSQLIRHTLEWLPEDTETLVVSQSFRVPAKSEFSLNQRQLQFYTRVLPLYDLAKLDNGKCLEPLAGRNVSLALFGARNVRIVSKFGRQACDGCSIVIFADPLEDGGRDWNGMVRTRSQEVRRMSGRDVFVFPSTWRTPQLPTDDRKQLPGEAFLVMLKPNVVLCATSAEYLAEVLTRIDSRPAKRALPDDLPEWKVVDLEAPSWMVRHIPDETAGQLIAGVVWSMTTKQIQVAYLPRVAKESEAVEGRIREAWEPGWLEAKYDVKFKADIERSNNGTIIVSSGIQKLDSHGHSRFRIVLFGLQAECGRVGDN